MYWLRTCSKTWAFALGFNIDSLFFALMNRYSQATFPSRLEVERRSTCMVKYLQGTQDFALGGSREFDCPDIYQFKTRVPRSGNRPSEIDDTGKPLIFLSGERHLNTVRPSKRRSLRLGYVQPPRMGARRHRLGLFPHEWCARLVRGIETATALCSHQVPRIRCGWPKWKFG